jgi:hypothetical protein
MHTVGVYRWTKALSNRDEHSQLLVYPKQNVVHFPPMDDNIDRTLRRVTVKIEDLMGNSKLFYQFFVFSVLCHRFSSL